MKNCDLVLFAILSGILVFEGLACSFVEFSCSQLGFIKNSSSKCKPPYDAD